MSTDSIPDSDSARELRPLWTPAVKVRAWLFGGLATLLFLAEIFRSMPMRFSDYAYWAAISLALGLLLSAAVGWWRAWRGPRVRVAIKPAVLHPGDDVRIVYSVDGRAAGPASRLSIAVEQRRYTGAANKRTFDRRAALDSPFETLLEQTVLTQDDEEVSAAGEISVSLPEALQRTYFSGRVWVGTLLVVRAGFERRRSIEQEFELILHRATS